MTGPRQPTVVMALHDGFYGCGTGAGRYNYALLEILVGLLPAGVRLVVLPVRLDPTSPEYDLAWHTEMATMLDAVGAMVYPVENGTAGQIRFGGLGCFRQLARHTADILTRCVLPDAHPMLILALDAPFLGLTPLLPPHVVSNLVLVPHSTARIHTPADRERIAWESHGLLTAAEFGGRIVVISDYMRAHLSTDYQVPDHALVDLPNGLSPADWQLPRPDDGLLPASVQEGFLLAMGRWCSPVPNRLAGSPSRRMRQGLPRLSPPPQAVSPSRSSTGTPDSSPHPKILPAWPPHCDARSHLLPLDGTACGMTPAASPPHAMTTHVLFRRFWPELLRGSSNELCRKFVIQADVAEAMGTTQPVRQPVLARMCSGR